MDDPRRDEHVEHVEHVEFAPTRVGTRGRRGLGRIVATTWMLAIAAVVGVGIASRGQPESALGTPPASPLPVARGLQPSQPAIEPAQLPYPTTGWNGPDLIALRVVPASSGIAVSGTILSRAVTTVLVSVLHADGSIHSLRSILVLDGGLRPVTPSFTIQLDLSTLSPGESAWVEANAYNNLGRRIGSVLQAVDMPTAHDPVRARTSLLR